MRGIGRWDALALIINGVIGAGIFGLPSKVHALVGVHGLLALAACAVLVVCIALCCAEVASRFSETGGAYLYTRRAFGPTAAFVVGWLMWITRITALAAIANVAVIYLAFFWEPAAAGWPRVAVLTVMILALGAANTVGVTRATLVCNVLTIGKVVPLLLFVAVGLFALDGARFAPTAPPELQPVSRAVILLMFAFGGFEALPIAAGEIREPHRNVPFATLVGVLIVAGLYLAIQVVCVGTLPGLAASERPLADAATAFMGATGGAVIAVGALFSTLGTSAGTLLMGPRLLYAMAHEAQLPSWLGRVHPRMNTPHLAIAVSTAIGLALAISGTFVYLLTLGVIARLTTYAATAAALLVFRAREERGGAAPGARALERPAAFRVPGGAIVPAITLLCCAWLMTTSGAKELRDVGLATLAGLAIYAAQRKWGAARTPSPSESPAS